jgi:hypothetical protein
MEATPEPIMPVPRSNYSLWTPPVDPAAHVLILRCARCDLAERVTADQATATFKQHDCKPVEQEAA